jgi:hypothetical protein
MQTTEAETAKNFKEEEAATIISTIINSLPGIKEKSVLFGIAKKNKIGIVVRQIGEMSLDKYNDCSGLIAAGAKATSENLPEQTAILSTGNIILIIAGVPRELGKVCLSTIAQKQKLIAS